MKLSPLLSGILLAALGLWCGGCSTTATAPPPLPPPIPAKSPEAVRIALPGTWVIDVKTSADVLAREQYKPRKAVLLHRDGMGSKTVENSTVTELFDAQAYREAHSYWLDLLRKPDMKWRITFKADGTGDHLAIITTGRAAQSTPFTWKLEGWVLHVNYPDGSKFRSFEVEMPSALEWNYPMHPLGDHIVLRRGK